MGEAVSAHCDVATGLVDHLGLRVEAYFAHPFIESGVVFLFLFFFELLFLFSQIVHLFGLRTIGVAALSVFAEESAGTVIVFEGVFAVGTLIDGCLSAGLQRDFGVNAHLAAPAVDDAVLLLALVADSLRALLLGEVIVAGGAAAVGALAVFKINLAVRAVSRLTKFKR